MTILIKKEKFFVITSEDEKEFLSCPQEGSWSLGKDIIYAIKYKTKAEAEFGLDKIKELNSQTLLTKIITITCIYCKGE